MRAHIFSLILAGRADCFGSVLEIGFGCFARDVVCSFFEVIGDRFRVRFDVVGSLLARGVVASVSAVSTNGTDLRL